MIVGKDDNTVTMNTILNSIRDASTKKQNNTRRVTFVCLLVSKSKGNWK